MKFRKNCLLKICFLICMMFFSQLKLTRSVDLFEPNDDIEHAILVTNGYYTDFAIESRYDQDFFKMDIKKSSYIQINVYSFNARAYFIKPDGSWYTQAEGTYGIFTIGINASEIGIYYLVVWSDSPGSNYSLEISGIEEIPNDFEYVLTQNFLNATQIIINGTLENYRISGNDYFYGILNQSSTLQIRWWNNSLSEIYGQIDIYNEQAKLIWRLDCLRYHTALITEILLSGKFFIVFRNFQPGYIINLSVQAYQDVYEENDNWDSALTLWPGENHTHILFNDDDYFKIPVMKGDSIKIFTSYCKASLYYPNGTLFQSYYSSGYDFDTESCFFSIINSTFTGFYYLIIDYELFPEIRYYDLRIVRISDTTNCECTTPIIPIKDAITTNTKESTTEPTYSDAQNKYEGLIISLILLLLIPIQFLFIKIKIAEKKFP